MSSIWEDFIDNIKDETGKLAKDELKDLVKNAKDDSTEFIKEQGEKLERYITQLAKSEINKGQFEGYVLDLADLTEMEANKRTVAAKASAQRLVEGVKNIIIDNLLSLI